MSGKKEVIDSHIHLFGKPHLDHLNWMDPQNKLFGNYRLDEYKKIVDESPSFESIGCIFIETDVKSGLEEDDWELAVQEYLFVERTVNNKQLEGEGEETIKDFIKAIIPWAPVPLGRHGLEKYIKRLKQRTVVKENWRLVKGFRYLLQDKPKETMLTPEFIDGLNWFAENGYTFDLGIDIHSNGIEQLEEFEKLDSKTQNVTYIINHLCKPDFSKIDIEYFKQLWFRISKSNRNKYYIKLSGAFSEFNDELAQSNDLDDIADKIVPYVDVFLKAFGPKNIIFGSDWPVSTLKFDYNVNSWNKWALIVRKISFKLEMSQDHLFKHNSLNAYNIDL